MSCRLSLAARGAVLALMSLGLAAVSPSGAQLAATWSELAPLPVAVSNNAVTAVSDADGGFRLFSFMGVEDPSDTSTITAAAYRFDWPANEWTSIRDAPLLDGRAKVGASAVTVAGEVYLLGGYSVLFFGEETEKRLFRYDQEFDRYERLADVPVEVDDTVAGVLADRYIVLISGWHGPINGNVANVQLYDTELDVWTEATQIPGPLPGLFGHAGSVVGDQLLYADGASDSSGFPISNRVFAGRIDAADLSQIAWMELPAHPGRPTYRAAASSGRVLGNGLLVVGGSDNTYNISGTGYDGEPSLPLDQVLYFSFDTGTWTEVATSGEHVPTMDHRALVGQGRHWLTIGGMTAPGETTARVFLLTLSE